jgi:dienelactone hydrolase
VPRVSDKESGARYGMGIRKTIRFVLFGVAALIWVVGVLSPTEPRDGDFGRGSVVLEDGIPVTIYIPEAKTVSGPGGVVGPSGKTFPLVVIAHGFVGDRVGLEYLAESLARNGYAVALYDAPGHGQNENPFGSSAGPSHILAMQRVIDWALNNSSVDGSRIVVAGHSMGAATALAFASSDERPKAVLAISGGWSISGSRRPPNTLFIYASGDPQYLVDRVRDVAADLSGDKDMSAETVYGAAGDGDAVALVEVSRTDHLTIVSSPNTVRWLVGWLRLTFGDISTAGTGPGSRLSPAEDASVAPRSGREASGLLFFVAAILAYAAGQLTGRVQRGSDWLSLDEKFGWIWMVGVWFSALAVGVLVAKIFGPSGAVALGLLSGLAVVFAASGTFVAAVASYSKEHLVATSPTPRGLLGFGVGSAALLILLAGAVSKLHNVALDPKRLLAAALLSAGFFPGLWGIEYLARRGSTLRSIAAATALKALALLAVAVAIGLGAMHPVMVLGLPLLGGILVYFELFALAGFRSGASPAVIAGAEAVTLGWIASALGPLQF